MTPKHARAGIAHDVAYSFFHRRFVAVNGTLSAGGFLFLIRAFIETSFGIGEQFVTRRAKFALLGVMAFPAGKTDHLPNRLVFPFQ